MIEEQNSSAMRNSAEKQENGTENFLSIIIRTKIQDKAYVENISLQISQLTQLTGLKLIFSEVSILSEKDVICLAFSLSQLVNLTQLDILIQGYTVFEGEGFSLLTHSIVNLKKIEKLSLQIVHQKFYITSLSLRNFLSSLKELPSLTHLDLQIKNCNFKEAGEDLNSRETSVTNGLKDLSNLQSLTLILGSGTFRSLDLFSFSMLDETTHYKSLIHLNITLLNIAYFQWVIEIMKNNNKNLKTLKLKCLLYHSLKNIINESNWNEFCKQLSQSQNLEVFEIDETLFPQFVDKQMLLTSIQGLTNLRSIEGFSLHTDNYQNYSKKLENLTLRYETGSLPSINQICQGFQSLNSLINLKKLTIDDSRGRDIFCEKVSSLLAQSLSSLQQLEDLQITFSTGVVDSLMLSIRKLPNLLAFDLDGNITAEQSDMLLESISFLVSLKSLKLSLLYPEELSFAKFHSTIKNLDCLISIDTNLWIKSKVNSSQNEDCYDSDQMEEEDQEEEEEDQEEEEVEVEDQEQFENKSLNSIKTLSIQIREDEGCPIMVLSRISQYSPSLQELTLDLNIKKYHQTEDLKELSICLPRLLKFKVSITSSYQKQEQKEVDFFIFTQLIDVQQYFPNLESLEILGQLLYSNNCEIMRYKQFRAPASLKNFYLKVWLSSYRNKDREESFDILEYFFQGIKLINSLQQLSINTEMNFFQERNIISMKEILNNNLDLQSFTLYISQYSSLSQNSITQFNINNISFTLPFQNPNLNDFRLSVANSYCNLKEEEYLQNYNVNDQAEEDESNMEEENNMEDENQHIQNQNQKYNSNDPLVSDEYYLISELNLGFEIQENSPRGDDYQEFNNFINKLKKCKQLNSLSIQLYSKSPCQMPQVGGQYQILSFPNLERLSLTISHLKFTKTQKIAISEQIKRIFSQLKYLYFSFFNMKDSNKMIFIKEIGYCKQLLTLYIQTRLSNPGVINLGRSLQSLKLLSSFSLTLNQFSGYSAEGLKALFLGIQTRENLQHLSLRLLSTQEINEDDVKLDEMIENITKLEYLDLNINHSNFFNKTSSQRKLFSNAFSKLPLLSTLYLKVDHSSFPQELLDNLFVSLGRANQLDYFRIEIELREEKLALRRSLADLINHYQPSFCNLNFESGNLNFQINSNQIKIKQHQSTPILQEIDLWFFQYLNPLIEQKIIVRGELSKIFFPNLSLIVSEKVDLKLFEVNINDERETYLTLIRGFSTLKKTIKNLSIDFYVKFGEELLYDVLVGNYHHSLISLQNLHSLTIKYLNSSKIEYALKSKMKRLVKLNTNY